MPKLNTISVAERRAASRISHRANWPHEELRAMTPTRWLKAIRHELKMNQRQLARRSGMAPVNVARIEGGKVDVRWSTLERLFWAMECDMVLLPLPKRRPKDIVVQRAEDYHARRDEHQQFDFDREHPDSRIWDLG